MKKDNTVVLDVMLSVSINRLVLVLYAHIRGSNLTLPHTNIRGATRASASCLLALYDNLVHRHTDTEVTCLCLQ